MFYYIDVEASAAGAIKPERVINSIGAVHIENDTLGKADKQLICHG